MNIDENWLNIETGKYKCPECKKEFAKKGISTHYMRAHSNEGNFNNSGTTGKSWTLGEDYISPRSLKKTRRIK